jgi:hypothetical protein
MKLPIVAIRNYCLSLFCLIIFASCAQQATNPQQTGGSVSGIIENQQGYTVPEATVQALDTSNAVIDAETTDSSGAFTLHKLPGDLSKVSVRVTHPDYTETSVGLQALITQTGTGTTTTGIALTVLSNDSCCGILDLTVLTPHGGGLGNAQVLVRRNDYSVASAYTDSTGHLIFHNLCAGSLNIRVSKDGYLVSERTFTIEHCDSTAIVDTMTVAANTSGNADSCCNGLLTIVAEDSATSAAISGASVIVSRSGMTRSETTNDHGQSGIHALCAGEYVVHISDTHYHSIEFSVTLTCNDTVTVTRLLSAVAANTDSCCSGRDYITVLDSATRVTLSGATVVLTNRTSGASQTETTNGSNLRFGNLCPGNYLCTISKDGYHTTTFDFQQGCDAVLSFSKSLLSITNSDSCCNGRDYITVIDSSTRQAIDNATVAVYLSGTQIPADTINYTNTIRLGNLCPGNYRVTIDHDGYHEGTIEFTQGCDGVLNFTKSLLSTGSNTNCDTASIQIHLQDSLHQDANLGGASVTVRIDGHSDNLLTGTTTDGGYFTAANLPGHTTYILTFSLDGYHTRSITIQVGDCRVYSETVQLSKL